MLFFLIYIHHSDQSCSVFYGPDKFTPLKLGVCDAGSNSCNCTKGEVGLNKRQLFCCFPQNEMTKRISLKVLNLVTVPKGKNYAGKYAFCPLTASVFTVECRNSKKAFVSAAHATFQYFHIVWMNVMSSGLRVLCYCRLSHYCLECQVCALPLESFSVNSVIVFRNTISSVHATWNLVI